MSHIPPIPIRDSTIRQKFPGLERRKFALPQRYETLNDSDDSQVKESKKELGASLKRVICTAFKAWTLFAGDVHKAQLTARHQHRQTEDRILHCHGNKQVGFPTPREKKLFLI